MKELYSRNSSINSRHLIGMARHMMFLARQKELSPFHISPRQFNILFILHELGHKATLAELASYSFRGTSSLSTQLTRMEKSGLLRKFRETPRSALLKFELTKKGLKCYENSNSKMRSVEVIMSILSEEERQQLISILKKIINKAENYNSGKY